MKHTKKVALTERQKQVTDLHSKGVSVKDIAINLGIKTVTVYATLKSARRRLGEVTRLNGKPSQELAVKAHHIGPGAGLAQLLAGLEPTFRDRNAKSKLKAVNIGCTFHVGDAQAKPATYQLALTVEAKLDKLAELARANGKVFVRREFILKAIDAQLKGVLS